MGRVLILLVAVLVLGACVPGPGADGGTLVSRATGLSGQYTAQQVISDHPRHLLLGHVIQVDRDGERLRALVISQRRDGVHALHFAEAWSDGTALPFVQASALDGCTHGHCRDRHAGFIFLSQARFAQAQTHGLRARLLGGQANVDVFAPAQMFQP